MIALRATASKRLLWAATRSYASYAPPPATKLTPPAAAAGNEGKLNVTFVLPHQVIFKNKPIHQINLATASGDMGILANHVPMIEQLRPGVLEIIPEANSPAAEIQKFFVSGGFAVINPNSTMNLTVPEAFPLSDFSIESVKAAIEETNRTIGNSATSEDDKAIAKVELSVFEAIQSALTSGKH